MTTVLDQTDDLAMTPAEATAIATLFADELARGWIPRAADIKDALRSFRAV
jgi:hypothetical protein